MTPRQKWLSILAKYSMLLRYPIRFSSIWVCKLSFEREFYDLSYGCKFITIKRSDFQSNLDQGLSNLVKMSQMVLNGELG